MGNRLMRRLQTNVEIEAVLGGASLYYWREEQRWRAHSFPPPHTLVPLFCTWMQAGLKAVQGSGSVHGAAGWG